MLRTEIAQWALRLCYLISPYYRIVWNKEKIRRYSINQGYRDFDLRMSPNEYVRLLSRR